MADRRDPSNPEPVQVMGMSEETLKKLSVDKTERAAAASAQGYPRFLANLSPPDSNDPLGNLISAGGHLKFESAEHADIAATLRLYRTDGGDVAAKDHNLVDLAPFDDGTPLSLKFGRVLTLAGDFFSNRGQYKGYFGFTHNSYNPISGSGTDDDKSMEACKARFSDMCSAIATDFNNSLHSIIPLLDQEDNAIQKAVGSHLRKGMAARAYHSHEGLPSDGDFLSATLGTKDALTGLYAALAWRNWDHFGEDALTCYTAGHWTALEKARAAYNETDQKAKEAKLNEAYFAEAAACHFLSDTFSSGHNRAPRKAFHNTSFAGVAAGNIVSNLFRTDYNVWDNAARVIHDDDSATGLVVKNALGDLWTAFGDKQFFMPANAVNRARCIQTVQASIDELKNIGYKSDAEGGDLSKLVPAKDFKALSLCPRPIQSYISTTTNETSIDNTTVLWKPTRDEVDPDQEYQTRVDPGNHSSPFMKTGRPEGHLLFENETCAAITNNPFRGDDQFPRTIGISTGATGILQAMQIVNNPGTDASSTSLKINSYGTVSFRDNNLPPLAPSLTLRNQSESFPLSQPTTSNTKLLHACTYTQKSGAESFFFTFFAGQSPGTNEYSLKMSAWKLGDTATPVNGVYFDMSKDRQEMVQTTQVVDSYELVKMKSSTKQLRFFVQEIGREKTPAVVVLQEYPVTGHPLGGRVVVDAVHFDVGSSPIKTDRLINFSFDTDRPALDMKLVTLTDGETYIALPFDGSTGPTSLGKTIGCYVVPFSGRDSGSGGTAATEPKIIITGLNLHNSGDENFLKASLTGPGSEDLIMLEYKPYPGYQFQFAPLHTNTSPSTPGPRGGEPPASSGPPAQVHKCISSERDLRIVQPYVNAVYPVSKPFDSSSDSTNPRALHLSLPSTTPSDTVFNISLVKTTTIPIMAESKTLQIPIGGSDEGTDEQDLQEDAATPYRILIRTHTPTASASTPSGLNVPTQWKCVTSLIPDPLVSSPRIESGYFNSLKWLPFEDVQGQGYPGLLQIFSWYGCLGFRTFGVRPLEPLPTPMIPKANTIAAATGTTPQAFDAGTTADREPKYILTGIQCYNGQTSKDLACGIEGMYGVGFGTTNTPSWGDVKEWFPYVQLPASSSSSGMAPQERVPVESEETQLGPDELGGWGHSYPNRRELVGKLLSSDNPSSGIAGGLVTTTGPRRRRSSAAAALAAMATPFRRGSTAGTDTSRRGSVDASDLNKSLRRDPTIVYGVEKFWRWGNKGRWWRT